MRAAAAFCAGAAALAVLSAAVVWIGWLAIVIAGAALVGFVLGALVTALSFGSGMNW